MAPSWPLRVPQSHFEVLEYTLEHSSDLINKVASEFDKLGADDFGSIRAHGVSHLKARSGRADLRHV